MANPVRIDGTAGLIEMTDSESTTFVQGFASGLDSDGVDARIAATIAVVTSATVGDSDEAVTYFGNNADVDYIFVTE